ncbi:MAG: ketopantoate reductase family protein [Faecalibacterium sp.]|nr:ketopantoate reductase family protein [Ruminococcus sp.]MCM1392498.1 ketopantoate reductase family protein [Ruminococcus sp.]MCM1486482.1 ketopantoate reductase family protein [Faecalibacterium sp.]
MKTIVIGAGAIGGTIAVLTKNAGYNVSILCHSEKTKNEIESNGFSLHGAKGEYNEKFTCYGSAEEMGDTKFDVCFIATKYAAMADSAKLILPYLKDNSLVVGMQNGICTSELAAIVGEKRAVGCMLGFGATRNSVNDVTMTSLGEMYIGMPNGYHPGMLDYLKSMLDAVLPTKISNDITREQYSKLIINSCINATAAITGLKLGKMIEDRRARTLYLAIAREGMRVAKAMNLDVPKYGKMLNYKMLMLFDNEVYNSMCRYVVWLVSKLKYADVKPSTLQSLEKGEKTEIDIFNGYFAAKGDEFSVPTPVNHKLTEMIHEIEEGKRKITPENLEEFRGTLF